MSQHVTKLQSVRRLIGEKNLKEAYTICRQLLTEHAENAEVFLLLTEIFEQSKQYSEAVGALSRYIQLKPDSATGYLNMSILLTKMGESEKAAKFYLRALTINQDDPDLRMTWISQNYSMNNISEVESSLGEFLNKWPDHAQALNMGGNIALDKANYTEAITYYSKALASDPDLNDSRINKDLAGLFANKQEAGKDHLLFIGLPEGKNFGWGICSFYLRRELKKKTAIFDLAFKDWELNRGKKLPGPYFFAIQDINLTTPFPARGTANYGYTFFENELTEKAAKNALAYDLVFAGSSWCVEKLNEKGIDHTGLLIQGVDPDYFFPVGTEKSEENFVLFSGGKFELRKGQDLVLRAVEILQKKYPDIILINIWYNFWAHSIATMQHSRHIRYEEYSGSWSDKMRHLYQLNGLDPERIVTYDVYDNHSLRELYAKTDLGVFPNRCEGGTNLVLMEYMACGKPVVATNATGHTDILTEDNALLLNHNKELILNDSSNKTIARWADPDLDELVDQIEFAYTNRKRIREIGQRAGEDLKKFSWTDSANQLLEAIHF